MTPLPYQRFSKEQWQKIQQNALHAHDRAVVEEANTALNAYEKADPAPELPTFTAGSIARGLFEKPAGMMHGDPEVARDLGDVGTGVWNTAKGIPRGIGQVLGELGQGHVNKAVESIAGGLVQTGKSAIAPWELAMRELAGENVSPEDRSRMLQQGGGGITALESMALPGQIGRGIGVLRGGGPPSGPQPPIEPSPVDLGKPPGPTPNAPTDPYGTPSNLPQQPAPPAGFERFGQPPAKPTGMETALDQLARGMQTPQSPQGFEPTAAGEPAAPASATPPQFTNPEPIADPRASTISGPAKGISVEGPATKPMTPANEALSTMRGTRVTGQKSVTFGPESPLSETAQASVKSLLGEMSRNPEAGFTTPETLALVIALGSRLGLGSGALQALRSINFGKMAGGAATAGLTGAGMSRDSTHVQ